MSSFNWPPIGGSGVAIYPTFADFPPSATTGSLAVAADTGNLYVFESGSWELLATPSDVDAITALTGDVTATGPGSVAATIEAIQGTTVAGTTGTTSVVFSDSPTLTGNPIANTITFAGGNGFLFNNTILDDSSEFSDAVAIVNTYTGSTTTDTSALFIEQDSTGVYAPSDTFSMAIESYCFSDATGTSIGFNFGGNAAVYGQYDSSQNLGITNVGVAGQIGTPSTASGALNIGLLGLTNNNGTINLAANAANVAVMGVMRGTTTYAATGYNMAGYFSSIFDPSNPYVPSPAVPTDVVTPAILVVQADTNANPDLIRGYSGNTRVLTVDYTGTISAGTWAGTTVAVAHGGTGQTSALTQYGVIYGASTTAMGCTAAGTAGYVLTANSGSAPTFQAIGAASNGFTYAGSNTSTYGGTYGALSFTSAYTVVIGPNAGASLTSGGDNTLIGSSSGNAFVTGANNVAVGAYTLNLATGNFNTAIGSNAGANNTTGSGSVYLGCYAGLYATASNEFYVNNVNQNTLAHDKAYSLLYGQFSGSTASLTGQQLTVNGTLNVNGNVSEGTWQGTTVAVGYGGTGQSSALTQYGVVYASTTTAMACTGYGTAANVLTGAGSGSAPLWSSNGGATVTLTASGGTAPLNAALGNSFYLSMSGNTTISAPTNPTDGQRITIILTASGGSYTCTLATTGTNPFLFGTALPVLAQTASGTYDAVSCIYNSTIGNWLVCAQVQGF